jgi:hypothetical protein
MQVLYEQPSPCRSEPDGAAIEGFRGKPINGFKGDATLTIFPIHADSRLEAQAAVIMSI